MSVLASLLSGAGLGDDGARLLYETVRRVSRDGNFPPPIGFQRWDNDAVETCAHEFLTGTRATERLVQMAALAIDDAALQRLLTTAVRNYMRDQGRHTVVGALIRRLKDVASGSDVISVDGEFAWLTGGPTSAFGGDEADLVRAALQVGSRRRRWRPDAKREGPLANRDEMVAMMRAILLAANGALSFATIGRVLARRYDLDPMPATAAVDVLDPHAAKAFRAIDVTEAAKAVLDQLSDIERRVLPLLDMSCRDAAALLPYGHSTVAKAQARLKTLLQQIVPAGDEGAALLKVVSEALAVNNSALDTS
jgi:hypothetical protein